MMDTFFKGEQSTEKPYRQLVLDPDESGKWRVRLLGGQSVKDAANVLCEETAATLDAGKHQYNEMRTRLEREGWQIFQPHYPPR